MRSRRLPRTSILSLVLGIALLWLAICGLLVWELGVPGSPREWLLLVGVGPPVYVAVQLLGEHVFGSRVSPDAPGPAFSWRRVLLGVFGALAIVGLSVPLTWLLRRG